jgi:hypothetical protein
MFGIFDFLQDAGNYEERKVSNDIVNGATIDTCAVSDSDHPFETGIVSPDYNDGKWVIVEEYDSKELAEIGHKKWVDLFTNNKPTELIDVSSCGLKKLMDAL